MNYTPERLERIYVAVSEARHARNMDRVTLGDYYKPASKIADRTLFDEVTPVKTLVLIDPTERMPVAWCPDESWARDYLETAPHPEELSLWEISREGDPAKDITIDFCDRWLEQVADYTEDEETFLGRLPAFVQAHFEDEALERYRNGRAPK